METARALKLVVGCLDAIQAGHTLGIVHKDLKPANLFLTNPMELTEMLRVTDFGIAATTDEQDGRLTQAGLQVGSPQYMAPEYLLDHAVSPTIDVYQMALILVEMLTGEAVVNDPSNFACLKIHARGRLPIPAKLLDCPLGPILTAALARDPMARFQSAGAFQTALMSVKAEDVPAILPTDERRILSPGTPPLPVSIGQKVSEPVEDVAALVAIANQDTAGEAGAALGARAARGEVASAATVVQPVVGLAGPETTHPLPTSRPVPKLALAGLASLIVAGFLLVVVGIVMDTDDSGPAEDTGAASASTTPDGDRPTVAAPDPEPEPDASVAVVADTPAGEPAPATVTVKVSVRPDNAEVYRGKEKLGRGSARLTFPSANADAIGLRVRAAGHKTRTVSIVPADAPTVMIKLVKKSRPTAGSGFLE